MAAAHAEGASKALSYLVDAWIDESSQLDSGSKPHSDAQVEAEATRARSKEAHDRAPVAFGWPHPATSMALETIADARERRCAPS